MKRDERRALIIGLGDLVLVPLAYAGAYYVRFGTLIQFRDKFSPVFLFMLTASYLTVFYFFDLYSVRRKIRNRTLAGRVILAVGASAVLASLVKYLVAAASSGARPFVSNTSAAASTMASQANNSVRLSASKPWIN